MYNFTGIVYRIWAVCGVLFLLGLILILFEKPWKGKDRFKKCKIGLLLCIAAVCLSLVYISRIVFPSISSYSGELISCNRNSRVAPPLPFTYEFVVWNGEGNKQVFYLDVFAQKAIFLADPKEEKNLTVYYDSLTSIIVKVEGDRNT